MCSDRQSELNASVYCQAFPQSSLILRSEYEQFILLFVIDHLSANYQSYFFLIIQDDYYNEMWLAINQLNHLVYYWN